MIRTSRHITRRVWDEVTRTPLASTEEIAQRMGVVKSTVSRALRTLRDDGFIDIPQRTQQARTILVPFVEDRRHG